MTNEPATSAAVPQRRFPRVYVDNESLMLIAWVMCTTLLAHCFLAVAVERESMRVERLLNRPVESVRVRRCDSCTAGGWGVAAARVDACPVYAGADP